MSRPGSSRTIRSTSEPGWSVPRAIDPKIRTSPPPLRAMISNARSRTRARTSDGRTASAEARAARTPGDASLRRQRLGLLRRSGRPNLRGSARSCPASGSPVRLPGDVICALLRFSGGSLLPRRPPRVRAPTGAVPVGRRAADRGSARHGQVAHNCQCAARRPGKSEAFYVHDWSPFDRAIDRDDSAFSGCSGRRWEVRRDVY